PVHQCRNPSLQRRDTTDLGCSSRRHKPGPGRGPPPLSRLRSLRSPPRTASLSSARQNAMLCSSEIPSS
ncbi:hypothetical protein QQF64_001157, partial [Cirrhinus molitorella]